MIRFGQRVAAIVAGALLLFSVVGALPAAAKAPSWSHKDAHVCGRPGPDQVRCTAIARAFYVDGQETATRTKKALAAYRRGGSGHLLQRDEHPDRLRPDRPGRPFAGGRDRRCLRRPERVRQCHPVPERLGAAGDPELLVGDPHLPDELGEQPRASPRRTRPAARRCRPPTPAGRTRSTWTCRPRRPSVRCAASSFSKSSSSLVTNLATAVTTASNTGACRRDLEQLRHLR